MKTVLFLLLAILLLFSSVFTGCDYITGQLPKTVTPVVSVKPLPSHTPPKPAATLPQQGVPTKPWGYTDAKDDEKPNKYLSAVLPEPDKLVAPPTERLDHYDFDSPLTAEKKARLAIITSIRIDEGFGDLTNLIFCTNLVHVSVYARDAYALSSLTKLPKLRSLSVSFKYDDDLTTLARIKNLEYLTITKPDGNITDIAPLASLTNLVFLNLSSNKITDLTPLSNLLKLTHLDLSYNQISDLSPLSSLKNIQYLNLRNNSITDVSSLSDLVSINDLNLMYNKITNIEPLESLKELRSLKLKNNQIVDVSPIVSILTLEELVLSGNPLDDYSINVIIPQLKERRITVYEGNVTELDKMLSLILTEKFEDGGYNVIKPELGLSYAGGFIAASTSHWSKANAMELFNKQGYDLSELWDRLFEENKEPTTMDIPSSLKDGYLIDYNHQFDTYFQPEFIDGWSKFRSANPNAHLYVAISLPVFDPNSNVVLVYYSAAGDLLAASGYIIAYKYENGKLEEIARVYLWIS